MSNDLIVTELEHRDQPAALTLLTADTLSLAAPAGLVVHAATAEETVTVAGLVALPSGVALTATAPQVASVEVAVTPTTAVVAVAAPPAADIAASLPPAPVVAAVVPVELAPTVVAIRTAPAVSEVTAAAVSEVVAAAPTVPVNDPSITATAMPAAVPATLPSDRGAELPITFTPIVGVNHAAPTATSVRPVDAAVQPINVLVTGAAGVAPLPEGSPQLASPEQVVESEAAEPAEASAAEARQINFTPTVMSVLLPSDEPVEEVVPAAPPVEPSAEPVPVVADAEPEAGERPVARRAVPVAAMPVGDGELVDPEADAGGSTASGEPKKREVETNTTLAAAVGAVLVAGGYAVGRRRGVKEDEEVPAADTLPDGTIDV